MSSKERMPINVERWASRAVMKRSNIYFTRNVRGGGGGVGRERMYEGGEMS